MAHHQFTVDIAAPIEQVYDLWTNTERMAEWVEGVTKVTDVTGPAGEAGTRYTVWFGRMHSPSEILEAERPHRLKSRFGNRLLRGETKVTFEPSTRGTRLTQEFRTQGVVPAIAAWVFALGSYKGSFRGELETFVRLAEREAHSSD